MKISTEVILLLLMNKILKLVLVSVVLLTGGLSFACDPCA